MAIDVPFIGGVNVPLFSSLLKSYTPAYTSITFDGIELNSGVDPNSWITITPNSKKYTYVSSVDGGGARMLTSNESATITVRLMQVSSVNKILYDKLRKDDGTQNLFANFTFEEPDGQGGLSYLKALNCYVSEVPTVDYSDTMGSIAWQFTCDKLEVSEVNVEQGAPVTSLT